MPVCGATRSEGEDKVAPLERSDLPQHFVKEKRHGSEEARRAIAVAAHRAKSTKRALRAGEDPIRVQPMMGWTSPAMVLRHVDELAQETASAELAEYAPI